MRLVTALTFGAALGSSVLPTGCVGTSPGPTSALPGVVARPAPNRPLRPDGGNSLPYLFVSQPYDNEFASSGDITILHNGSYKTSGVMTAGLNTPHGLFLDEQSNLYAANQYGSTVTEYTAHSYGAPSFTYSDGLFEPVAVAADTNGNVFVSQYSIGSSLPGAVDEYSQQVNSVVAQCSALPEGGALGVAVDSNDDVFVTWYYASNSAIFEYIGNLQSCDYLNINLPVATPYGLAIDKHGNLLIANLTEVVVADPPYASVSRVLASGFEEAVTVHLNRQNTLAYITDYGACTVTVLSYPSGSIVKVLGFSSAPNPCPYAAVDSPNAVY